jgi:hypothetical protein
MGCAVGSSGDDVRPAKRHENALFLAPVFTLEPFWAGYAVLLVVLFVWIRRLSAEVTRQDVGSSDRDIAPLLRDIGSDE